MTRRLPKEDRRVRFLSFALSVCIFLTTTASSSLAETWTELFETGVGRLSQTNGNGDSVFIYNAAAQAIDGTFIRYVHGNPSADRRYALLEAGLTDWKLLVAEFSIVVTPQFLVAGNGNKASIGLLNSSLDSDESFASVNFRSNGQAFRLKFAGEGSSPLIPFVYGETCYIEATFDGPNQQFHMDAYRGIDATGVFLGSSGLALPPAIVLSFDAIGLTNVPATGSVQSEVHARIHELRIRVTIT